MEPSCDSGATCDIPVWLDGTQRWVTGLTKRTTCDDVIYALLYSNGLHETESTDSYAIFEKWREVERPLSSRTKLVKVWNFWGQEQSNVQLSMRHVDDYFFPGDSSLYLRSRRRHKRSSRVKSKHISHGRHTSRRAGCVECTRLKSLEQLVELVVCQERKIKEIQDRIQHTDRLVETHEARIHQHRVEHNGMDYVQDSYLNSHSSSSSSSIDSSVFTTIDLKKVKSIFPQSSWQDLEDIMRMCEDISDMEKRKSEEMLKLNRQTAEMEGLVENDKGREALLRETNDELEETRVEMVRAVSSHISQEYNEKELDHKMVVLERQIQDKQKIMWDLQNQIKEMDEAKYPEYLLDNQEVLQNQTLQSPHLYHHPQHDKQHNTQLHERQHQQQQPGDGRFETMPYTHSHASFQQNHEQHTTLQKTTYKSENNVDCNQDQIDHANHHHHYNQLECHDNQNFETKHNQQELQNMQQHYRNQQRQHPELQQQNQQQHWKQQQDQNHHRSAHQEYNPVSQSRHFPSTSQYVNPYSRQKQPTPSSSTVPKASPHVINTHTNHPAHSLTSNHVNQLNHSPKDPNSSRSRTTNRSGQRSFSISGGRSVSKERSKSEERIRSQSDTFDLRFSREHPLPSNETPISNTDVHIRQYKASDTRYSIESARGNRNILRYSDTHNSLEMSDLSDKNHEISRQQLSNLNIPMRYENHLVKHDFESMLNNDYNENLSHSNHRRQTIDSGSQGINLPVATGMGHKQHRGEEQTKFDVTAGKQGAASRDDRAEDQRKQLDENVKPREFNHIQSRPTTNGQMISLHKECEQRDAVSNQQEKNRIYLERLLSQQQKQQPQATNVQTPTTWNGQHKHGDQNYHRQLFQPVGAGINANAPYGNNYYHYDDHVANNVQKQQGQEKRNESDGGLCYNVKTNKIGALPSFHKDTTEHEHRTEINGGTERPQQTSSHSQLSSTASSHKSNPHDKDTTIQSHKPGSREPIVFSGNSSTGFEKDMDKKSRLLSSDTTSSNSVRGVHGPICNPNTNTMKGFPTKLMARFQRNRSYSSNHAHNSSTNVNNNEHQTTKLYTSQNSNLVTTASTSPGSAKPNSFPSSSSSNLHEESTPDSNDSNRGALYHILSNKLNKSSSKQSINSNSTSKSTPLVNQHQNSPSSNSSIDSIQDRHQGSKDSNPNLPYCSSTSSSSTTINAYLSSDDTTGSSNSRKSREKDCDKTTSVQNFNDRNSSTSGGTFSGTETRNTQNIGKSFLVQSSYLSSTTATSNWDNRNNKQNEFHQNIINHTNTNNTFAKSAPQHTTSSNPAHMLASKINQNHSIETGVVSPEQISSQPTSSRQQQMLKSPGSRRRGVNPNFCDIVKDTKVLPSSNNGSKKPTTISDDQKSDSSITQYPSQFQQDHNMDRLPNIDSYTMSKGEEFGNRNINFANVVFGDRGIKSKQSPKQNYSNNNVDRKVDVQTILDKRQTMDKRGSDTNDVGSRKDAGSVSNGLIYPAVGPSSTLVGKTKMEDSNDSNSDTGLSSMHSDETANLETLV